MRKTSLKINDTASKIILSDYKENKKRKRIAVYALLKAKE